jgi:hypothetical protein
MPRRPNPNAALLKELRAFGLTYPGAHTKSQTARGKRKAPAKKAQRSKR